MTYIEESKKIMYVLNRKGSGERFKKNYSFNLLPKNCDNKQGKTHFEKEGRERKQFILLN